LASKKAKDWLDLIGNPSGKFTCAQLSTKSLYLSDGVILNTGAHEVTSRSILFGPGRIASSSGAPDAKRRGHGRRRHRRLRHSACHGIRSSFHLDFVTPIAFRDFRIIGDDVPSIAT